MYFHRDFYAAILLISLLSSCAPAVETPIIFPTYDPFLPLQEEPAGQPAAANTSSPLAPTATRPSTPTRVALTVSPLAAGPGGQILNTPTPDTLRILPTPRQQADEYEVQAGDTLGLIAERYGISVQALMQANNIGDPNLLSVGTLLKIPVPNPVSAGTSFKIIPDSEMVHGPASVYFDVMDFTESQNGYLENYTQDVNGILLSGSEVITTVAQNYSVNPRLLVALLEYQSGWVTNPTPFNTSYPMGLADESRLGLYRQLAWAADTLNRGYYLWRANALATWVMSDGQIVPIDPTINAGTAAVQYFFSELGDLPTWQQDVSGTGVFLTYYVLFGNPFTYAIEPLVSPSITQPALNLPFNKGEAWYFTGGPHGGWDSGSAWAALDFAPPNGEGSCAASARWVTALGDGLVIRASNGAVIQDLDNDGYEQTGWVIFYMHIAEQDRAKPGEYLFAGDQVGHPSCEGGVSNATHVHIARKYNGEWIAADGLIPFNLDGWISSGSGSEYNGFLTRGSTRIEAWDSANEFNLITR
ncbi:MAG: LysM peptidoglycan-binding domain-containing protein [Anaerolineales bacterium]|nr:MAG: LysM peptidoglycan-binding domain-containing protein [Anaerolineales bacterium]